MRKCLITILIAVCLGAATAYAVGNSVVVVHWWTSGGEAAALSVLKEDMDKRGYLWRDSPIAGGGGDQARAAVRGTRGRRKSRMPCRCWAIPSPTMQKRACWEI